MTTKNDGFSIDGRLASRKHTSDITPPFTTPAHMQYQETIFDLDPDLDLKMYLHIERQLSGSTLSKVKALTDSKT